MVYIFFNWLMLRFYGKIFFPAETILDIRLPPERVFSDRPDFDIFHVGFFVKFDCEFGSFVSKDMSISIRGNLHHEQNHFSNFQKVLC